MNVKEFRSEDFMCLKDLEDGEVFCLDGDDNSDLFIKGNENKGGIGIVCIDLRTGDVEQFMPRTSVAKVDCYLVVNRKG